jgi:hypothetical protein
MSFERFLISEEAPPLKFKSLTGTSKASINRRGRGVLRTLTEEVQVHMNIHFRLILAISLGLGLTVWLPASMKAGELKEAQVTQVIQDVRLLPSNAAPRPASVSDRLHEDTAVRTGVESRTELTFQDMTLTRLGSQTIFSFKGGTRTINLKSGSILLSVPKNSGGGQIKTAAVTASVTG